MAAGGVAAIENESSADDAPVKEAPAEEVPVDEAPEVSEVPEETEAVPDDDGTAPELDGPLVSLPPMMPAFWLGVPATLLR